MTSQQSRISAPSFKERLSVTSDNTVEFDEELIIDGNTNRKRKESIKKPYLGENKCTMMLKAASFGQYKTPLYYKQRETYSSACGGVITIIAVTLFIAYAIWVVVGIFQKDQMELIVDNDNLSYQRIFNTNSIVELCDEDPCKKLTLREFVTSYFAHEPEYCITFTPQIWPKKSDPASSYCAGVEASVLYTDITKDGLPKQKIVTNTQKQWNVYSEFRQCCS